MKIGIVGSRGYGDWARVFNFVYGLPTNTQIVSGGCPKSPDEWAIAAAQNRQRLFGDLAKPIIFPVVQAPGESFGFAAYRRNVQIIECGIEKLYAFWDGASKGTKNAIQIADRKAIPVEIIYPTPQVATDGNCDKIANLDKREECRLDLFTLLCVNSELSEEAIEKALPGYNMRQIVFTLQAMENERLVCFRVDGGAFGDSYWSLAPGSKTPCKPADVASTEALPALPGDSPEQAKSAVESPLQPFTEVENIGDLPGGEAHAERLTDAEESQVLDEFNQTPPKHRAALRAISDFEKSVKSEEDESDNWDFGEYPYEEVRVNHYQPKNNKVIANVYNFRDGGRCSCPRQGFISVPCKHTIAREKKLKAYRENRGEGVVA